MPWSAKPRGEVACLRARLSPTNAGRHGGREPIRHRQSRQPTAKPFGKAPANAGSGYPPRNRECTISIGTRGAAPPNLTRFRALALLGRPPRASDARLGIPASEKPAQRRSSVCPSRRSAAEGRSADCEPRATFGPRLGADIRSSTQPSTYCAFFLDERQPHQKLWHVSHQVHEWHHGMLPPESKMLSVLSSPTR